MNEEKIIRKLARSNYWQNIYNASKTCGGVNIFNNQNNFSRNQVDFLYWLAVYSSLYDDLAQQSDEFLTKKVIENDYRTDAFLIYRNKKAEHEWKKLRQEEKLSQHKSRHKNKHKSGETSMISVDLRKK